MPVMVCHCYHPSDGHLSQWRLPWVWDILWQNYPAVSQLRMIVPASHPPGLRVFSDQKCNFLSPSYFCTSLRSATAGCCHTANLTCAQLDLGLVGFVQLAGDHF